MTRLDSARARRRRIGPSRIAGTPSINHRRKHVVACDDDVAWIANGTLRNLYRADLRGRYPDNEADLYEALEVNDLVNDAEAVLLAVESHLEPIALESEDAVAMPKEWRATAWSGPMPDVASAVRRSRRGH